MSLPSNNIVMSTKKPAGRKSGTPPSNTPISAVQKVSTPPAQKAAGPPNAGAPKKVTVIPPPPDVEAGGAGLGLGPKMGSFVAPRVYFDEDAEEAPRQGWISGPCDCFLSIWATLGDAIEGGAA